MNAPGQTQAAFVPRYASRRERRQENLRWAAALVLALGWQVSWMVWLRVRPPPVARGVPPATRVAYLPPPAPGSGAVDPSEDIRVTWSPALFSLPTPAGFSRPAMTNEIRLRPPVSLPGGDPVLLERESPAPVPFADAGTGLAGRVAARLESLERPGPLPPVFRTAGSATGVVVSVELSGGLAGQQFAVMELPAEVSAPRDRPWEVRAWVEIGEDGRVAHVLLEQPSPFETLNSLIHRTLLGWRLADDAGPRSGRITLRQTGGPAPAGAAENGARS